MHRTVKSALAIVVTVGIGIPLWRFGIAISDAPPPAPPRELGPVPVSLVEVKGEPLELGITVHGNLFAHERAVVSSELTARIEGVHPGWRPGGEFAEGETLVHLDEETSPTEETDATTLASMLGAVIEDIDFDMAQGEADGMDGFLSSEAKEERKKRLYARKEKILGAKGLVRGAAASRDSVRNTRLKTSG